MHFAFPLPWWLAVFVAVAIVVGAYLSYRRPPVPLTRARRILLMGLRALALAAIVFFLCRPIVLLPPPVSSDVVVPILVDTSRSMRIPDADGRTRIARAVDALRDDVLPALAAAGVRAELHEFGEALAPVSMESLRADAARTDLGGALAAVREKYRSRRSSGIIVLSDGADTGPRHAPEEEAPGPPVFTVGVGSVQGPTDRELLGIAAGDARLDQTSIDLRVTAVSHGLARDPFQLRLLANGTPLESRTVTPEAPGSPIDVRFTVSPDPITATVYTAEIVPSEGDSVVENNARAVLVNPAGRKRRVLVLQGAPGYEHSFLVRALVRDPGLAVDSVVRKGKNETGEETFYVQAAQGAAENLTAGFPATREALYAYDALVIANLEGDFFTGEQLSQASDFVGERGGGLLVLGARSFEQRGLIGTPLEEVLPVELNDRRGGPVRASSSADVISAHHTVRLMAEGEDHAVMRIAATPDEIGKRWSALPALAAIVPLGGARPGATVLATTASSSGATYPLVAVQRYGGGRSMVFAGEGSWRWRMLMPSDDRSHEYFWRQAVRWLASPAPDPVSIAVPDALSPGEAIEVAVDARDGAFAPADDAVVEATLSEPGSAPRALSFRKSGGGGGRFIAALRPAQPGLYRVLAEARRGAQSLGTADRWFHVGGADREFFEPRLNEGVLERVARASGGQYVPADRASEIVPLLRAAVPEVGEPEQRDLWHHPWSFALLIVTLAAEWVLRRRWGLA
jgi:uncharacterized membrane protein